MFAAILLSLSLSVPGWVATSSGARTSVEGQDIEIQFYSTNTVRVTKTPSESSKPLRESLSIIARPAEIPVTVKNTGRTTLISSEGITVKADNKTGLLTFCSPSGRVLSREVAPATMAEAPFEGADGLTVSQTFAVDPKEHLYGLGSLARDTLSRRNFTARLLPGNQDDSFPVVQSSAGYGIIWDNYSPTVFADNGSEMTFSSEIGDGVDYYFINGRGKADNVIAEMRLLSGDVPMHPLWTYGYWQSRERYRTQHEPVAVLRRYREEGIPLDGIIQDWQYWGNNYLWNAMEFMNPDYDHPQEMVDSIHALDGHMIISIWSSFGPATKPFAELRDKGLLFDISTWPQSGIEGWPPRMDYPSGVKVYNPYSSEARDIYWKHLSRIHGIGMDGWWMDSTEPDHFDDTMDFPTGQGTFRRVRGAFPLLTVGGVYDHQLAADSTRRVFILTRSGWFGQQRTGANVWTGDVTSTWEVLRRQLPQHLNFTMSGNPNTNSDLGGFFCGRYNTPSGPAYDNPLFRELTVRWTQLGAFTPMMRSHGTESPREIYLFGEKGEPTRDALAQAVRLRYDLLPYIYSTARDVSANSGSFMRPLVMDFPHDRSVLNASDRFMFGRSLLVAPILKAHYTAEDLCEPDSAALVADFTEFYPVSVELPKGTDWFNFFTGEKYRGGSSATLQANIFTIPLFAKAGSIIPIGPEVEYATEKPWDNLTIRIFPGADGRFDLYEDEGDNYNYRKGQYSIIPLEWDNSRHTLTIGQRRGTFPGMIESRSFAVVNAATGKTATVSYDGSSTSIEL